MDERAPVPVVHFRATVWFRAAPIRGARTAAAVT